MYNSDNISFLAKELNNEKLEYSLRSIFRKFSKPTSLDKLGEFEQNKNKFSCERANMNFFNTIAQIVDDATTSIQGKLIRPDYSIYGRCWY